MGGEVGQLPNIMGKSVNTQLGNKVAKVVHPSTQTEPDLFPEDGAVVECNGNDLNRILTYRQQQGDVCVRCEVMSVTAYRLSFAPRSLCVEESKALKPIA